jgi:hypothetical protein
MLGCNGIISLLFHIRCFEVKRMFETAERKAGLLP